MSANVARIKRNGEPQDIIYDTKKRGGLKMRDLFKEKDSKQINDRLFILKCNNCPFGNVDCSNGYFEECKEYL